jgi:hypothetical protein
MTASKTTDNYPPFSFLPKYSQVFANAKQILLIIYGSVALLTLFCKRGSSIP